MDVSKLQNLEIKEETQSVKVFSTKREPKLNIWTAHSEHLHDLLSVLEKKEFRRFPLRLIAVSDLDNVENIGFKGINLVYESTSLKVCTVHKGLVKFTIKGKNLPSPEETTKILWPTHSEYPVGYEAPMELRNSFLMGMNTFTCKNVEDGIEVNAWVIPGYSIEELRENISGKLAGLKVENFSIVDVDKVYEPASNVLDKNTMGLIFNAFKKSEIMGPDFEWHPFPGVFNKIVNNHKNVFSLGAGCIPDPSPLTGQCNKQQPTSTEEFERILYHILNGME